MNITEDNYQKYCRLCSSKEGLIRLFKGKNIYVKDLIRKLIAITLGIKFEENGYINCVCFTCVVRTFNFYLFKINCLKNEEQQKSFIKENTKNSKKIKDLTDIDFPPIDKFKEILSDWLNNLLSKLNPKSATEENESIISTYNVEIQTDEPKCYNVEIQTDQQKCYNVEVQTEIHYQNVQTQCNISLTENLDKKSIPPIQDDKIEQSNFLKNTKVKDRTINNIVKSKIKSSKVKERALRNILKKSEFKAEKIDSIPCIENKNILTDEKSPFKIKSKQTTTLERKVNDLLDQERSGLSLEAANPNNTFNAICKNKVDSLHLDLKENEPMDLIDIKEERISPVESFYSDLNIMNKSSPLPKETVNFPCSGLLQVTGKVLYLKSCRECGAVKYTKIELEEHRKGHLICYLCKKKFRSIKKTKEHIQNQCLKRICSRDLSVSLVKLENCKDILNEYPNVKELVNNAEANYVN